jgi:hypothetical protein
MWPEDQDENRGATGRLNEQKLDNAGLKAAWKLNIIQPQGPLLRGNLLTQHSPAGIFFSSQIPTAQFTS